MNEQEWIKNYKNGKQLVAMFTLFGWLAIGISCWLPPPWTYKTFAFGIWLMVTSISIKFALEKGK